jgi:hypothetical protein
MEVGIANHIRKHKVSIVRWNWRKCGIKSWLDEQKPNTKAMQEGNVAEQTEAQKIHVTLHSKLGE